MAGEETGGFVEGRKDQAQIPVETLCSRTGMEKYNSGKKNSSQSHSMKWI